MPFPLDLTLNPDFSQVESDEPQVTVNQRYEVFFPEKRPFSSDNAGYFKTPVQLFSLAPDRRPHVWRTAYRKSRQLVARRAVRRRRGARQECSRRQFAA